MGQMTVEEGGVVFLAEIESRLAAVDWGIRLAIRGGTKWPPQLKHS